MDLFQPLLNPLFWFQPTWDLDPPCCFSVTKSCLTLWTTWTQWTTAYQASLSFTISQRLLKVMSIESVMPSNYLILCHVPFSSCTQSFPASGSFSICIRWPKKAEHRKIDAFELWCWRRLFRIPWTARRSNQSILKEKSLNTYWKN